MNIKQLAKETYQDTRSMGPGFNLHRFHRRPGRSFRVPVRGVGSVTLRSRSSDAAVFSQVFTRRDYELRWFPQFEDISACVDAMAVRGRRPLVLDLGANNGASALWFARMFPTAKVVAVEPVRDSALLFATNTRGYDIEVMTAAIGSERGSVDVVTEGVLPWASTTTRSDDGAIPMITVDEIVTRQGSDLELLIVKIDIEGFESDLFAANTDWVATTKVIIVEPHDWMLPGQASSHNFQQVLSQHDFELLISGENLVYVRRDQRGG